MTIKDFILTKTISAVNIALDYNIITELFIDNDTYNIDVDKSQLPTLYASKKTSNFNITDDILTADGVSLNLATTNILGVKWHMSAYPKRIIAQNSLVLDDVGSKMFNWFKLNNLPTITKNNLTYVYVHEILPEHLTIFNSFGPLITLENKP